MLELHALGGGLDDDLAVGEVLERGRGPQPLLGPLRVLRSHPPLAHLALQLAQDPRHAALQRVRVGVVQERLHAGDAAELRDPGPHRPGPGDAEDRGRVVARAHDGTSALMPVSARPMMSFWICEVPS